MLKHTMHRFEEFCFFLLSLLPGDAYYIGGPENLPPPLDHEQEELVFEQLETGNPHARELLITHNLRLVVYIAKKFENSGVSVEDIISIGTIGLIKAVNTFKPSKKIKQASIDEPLNTDSEGNELLLLDVLSSDQNQVGSELEHDAECRTLHDAVNRLQPRERQIMQMRFGLLDGVEHTQKEVADEIGISQSYISRLEKRIIRRLRRELETLV